MKNRILTLLILLNFGILPNLFSQNVSINSTGSLPDTSAMLDVSSTTKGFLMPRMTTLPTASTCAKRRYTIVNRSGSARTFTNGYTNLVGGTGILTMAANISIEIISDGTNWLGIR